MKLNHYFVRFNDHGETIASFGQARLVKYLDGKYELCDGSREDRQAAREWISLFCHDVVVREPVRR